MTDQSKNHSPQREPGSNEGAAELPIETQGEALNSITTDADVDTTGDLPDSAGPGSPPLGDRTITLPLLSAIAAVVIAALIGLAATYFVMRGSSGPAEITKSKRVKGLVVDSFDLESSDKGLTLTSNGKPWMGNVDAFAIRSGDLQLADRDQAKARVVVVDTGAPNHVVAASFGAVRAGSGIIFRYKGPNNFWSLTAAPATGTWTLTKVINGKRENPLAIGSAPTADGTDVMVRTEGNRMFFYFDGVQYNTLNDGDLGDGTKGGVVIAGPKGGEVRVSGFAAFPLRPQGPGAKPAAPATPDSTADTGSPADTDSPADTGEAAPTTTAPAGT